MSDEGIARPELEAALCCQIASGPDLATLLPERFNPDDHVHGSVARELAWAAIAAARLGKSWDDFGGLPPIAALGVEAAARQQRRSMNTWRAVLVGLCGEAGLNRSMVRKYLERCDDFALLALRSPASWLMELTAEEEGNVSHREIAAVQADG